MWERVKSRTRSWLCSHKESREKKMAVQSKISNIVKITSAGDPLDQYPDSAFIKIRIRIRIRIRNQILMAILDLHKKILFT